MQHGYVSPVSSAPASAATRAYDHLKRAVLDGTHPGGTLLTEGEVAEQLGVSRTPVREALLRLEAEGLVRLYPKKGALVVPVSAQEAHDVVEARALIEEWAAGRAWARRDEIVPQLEPLVEEMRRARGAEAFLDFTAADRSFHECVVAAAGNDVLTRSYRGLQGAAAVHLHRGDAHVAGPDGRGRPRPPAPAGRAARGEQGAVPHPHP